MTPGWLVNFFMVSSTSDCNENAQNLSEKRPAQEMHMGAILPEQETSQVQREYMNETDNGFALVFVNMCFNWHTEGEGGML